MKVLAHSSNTMLVLAGLILSIGCVPPSRPPVGAAEAPETVVPASPEARPSADAAGNAAVDARLQEPADPVDKIIDAADELYVRGLAALRRKDEMAARAAFDASVLAYLQAPPALQTDVRLRQEFQDLVQEIHQAEVEEQRGAPVAPLEEDLKAITAYLTPEQAVRERQKVQEKNATVVFDLPIEINNKVVAFIDAFKGPRRKLFEPGMIRSGRYVGMIRRVFQSEGIPQDLGYLVHIESAFKPTAYSRARARGLFQFIASTGRRYGLRSDWWVDMRADPELAAHAAARYLKRLHQVYGDWYLALAEYNGGPRVRRAWIRSGRKATFWDLARRRSLRRETRNYVPQILAAIILHKSPEKYGLTTRRDAPLEYETLPLDDSIDLRVAARLAGTNLDEMIRLNPGLRRLATPPDYPDYPLHLPAGTAAVFKTELARLPAAERLPWYRHRVARGETLSTIAVRYGTTIYAIQQANSLKNPHRIYKGQDLMIPGSAVRVAALAATEVAGVKNGDRITHRVRRGDTLSSIARRYRTNIASLVEWNALSNASLIRPGQKLVVYAGLTASQIAHPSGPHRARAGGAGKARKLQFYTVRRGDTLYSIALQNHVSVSALQNWNQMGHRTLIHPGVRLKLYF